MAVRGRKPETAQIHKLRGTERKDRHGTEDERVTLPAEAPDPPDYLTGDQKQEWFRVVNAMKDAGVIASADQAALEGYVLLVDQMRKEREEFPASRHGQLRGYIAVLGLSPGDRARLRVPKSGNSGNPFGSL